MTTALEQKQQRLLLRSIGVVLIYLLLLDAAVETLLSRPPLWWVLVPLLAAYLAISAILWRRTGRPPAFIVSLAVLLGLLAFSAWLPEGATRGITLLGQPTSTVLIVITIVTVIIAGVRLMREPSFPLPLKWIIGALALYSLSAFLFGVIAGVAYPDLFHWARWRLHMGGRSVSLGLPGWLQGSFIGAFLLLPAALVAQGLRSLFVKRTAPDRPRQFRLTQAGVEAIALSLSLVMALGALRTPAAGRTSPAATGRIPPAATPSEEITRELEASVNDLTKAVQAANPSTLPPGEQAAAQLEKAFPELEARANAIPREAFDVQALADKVGRDPVALFQWVRDQTRVLPYRGVLKGSSGVLMDRGGNSLDRALLLDSLLRAGGFQTQLARATLSQEQARRVVERASQPVPQLPVPQPVATPDDLVESLSRSSGMSRADVKRHLERVTAEHRRLNEITKARIREQTQALARAVGRPAVRDAQAEAATLLETLRDHWWVRWMREGTWVDLDPTLADAAPGSVLTSAQELYAAQGLPNEVFHLVTIRIVVERLADGRLSEQPVLTYTFRTADLHAKQLILTHRPVNFPSTEFLRESDALERFKRAVVGISGWVPMLAVGDSEISQSGFTAKGEVRDKGALVGGPGAQAGERVRDLLSGPRGGSPAPRSEDKEGHLTAEWIDYEVHVPREPSTTVRRQVFDLIGAAVRRGKLDTITVTDTERLERGLALFGTTFILPQAAWVSLPLVDYLVVRQLLDHRDLLVQQLRHGSQDANELSKQTAKVKPLAIPAYVLAVTRPSVSGLWPDVYLSRVNIHAYRSGWLRLKADGTISLSEGFDIVANQVSMSAGSGRDAFLTRLEQGVADTVAEAMLTRGSGPVENVSEIFAVSTAQRANWVTLKSTGDPAWRTLKLSDDIRAKIERDLAAGYVVTVPEAPVLLGGRPTVGWWRVDPRTGNTMGIGESGAGQSATEMWIVISTAAIAATVCLVIAVVVCVPGLSQREAFACFLAGLAGGLLGVLMVLMMPLAAPYVMSVPAGAPFIPTWTAEAAQAFALSWTWFTSLFGGGLLGGYVLPGGDLCPSYSQSGPSPGPTPGSPQDDPSPPPGSCREIGRGTVRIERCSGSQPLQKLPSAKRGRWG